MLIWFEIHFKLVFNARRYTGWFYYYLRNCTAKNGMALKKRFNVCRVYLSFTLVILSKKEICTGTQKHKAGVLKQ